MRLEDCTEDYDARTTTDQHYYDITGTTASVPARRALRRTTAGAYRRPPPQTASRPAGSLANRRRRIAASTSATARHAVTAVRRRGPKGRVRRASYASARAGLGVVQPQVGELTQLLARARVGLLQARAAAIVQLWSSELQSSRPLFYVCGSIRASQWSSAMVKIVNNC